MIKYYIHHEYRTAVGQFQRQCVTVQISGKAALGLSMFYSPWIGVQTAARAASIM